MRSAWIGDRVTACVGMEKLRTLRARFCGVEAFLPLNARFSTRKYAHKEPERAEMRSVQQREQFAACLVHEQKICILSVLLDTATLQFVWEHGCAHGCMHIYGVAV